MYLNIKGGADYMLRKFSSEIHQLSRKEVCSHRVTAGVRGARYLGGSSLIHDLQQQSLVLLPDGVFSISQSVY